MIVNSLIEVLRPELGSSARAGTRLATGLSLQPPSFIEFFFRKKRIENKKPHFSHIALEMLLHSVRLFTYIYKTATRKPILLPSTMHTKCLLM